jgi:hypothetical protein
MQVVDIQGLARSMFFAIRAFFVANSSLFATGRAGYLAGILGPAPRAGGRPTILSVREGQTPQLIAFFHEKNRK